MENETNKLLGLERCILLQALAESYLLRTTGKHFNDAYPEVVEEYGVLLEEHVKLLKKFLFLLLLKFYIYKTPLLPYKAYEYMNKIVLANLNPHNVYENDSLFLMHPQSHPKNS